MGMPPGLPFFGPQMGAPQLGGSAQNNRYPAPGLQPYPTNKVGAIAEGLEKFMTSFFGTKEALKQHYDQKATDALLKIQAGLLTPNTADQKKILSWMQKADWPVRTEAPTPAEAQYNQQQQKYDAAQRAQMSLLNTPPQSSQLGGLLQQAGVPSPTDAAMAMNQQVQPPGPAPARPNPTLLQRLGFNRPPVDTNSAMGQYLQQLTQASQGGAPLNPANVATKGRLSALDDMFKGTSLQNQIQIANMARQALDDTNPRQNDALINLGKLNIGNLGLSDLLWAVRAAGGSEADAAKLRLGAMTGMPQLLMKRNDLAKDLLSRTWGDGNQAWQAATDLMFGGRTDIPLKMTLSEAKDQSDVMDKIGTNKPFLPLSNVWQIARGQAGDPIFQPMLNSNQKIADETPNKGTIAYREWQQEQNVRNGQLGLNIKDVMGNLENRRDQLAVNVVDSVVNALGKEGETARQIIDNPSKYSPVQVQAALQKLANIDLKESLVQVVLPGTNGQTIRIGDPATVQGSLWRMQQRGWGFMKPDPFLTQPPAQVIPNQGTPQPGPGPRGTGLNALPPNPLTDPLGIGGGRSPYGAPQIGASPIGMGGNELTNILQYINNPEAQAGQNWLRQQRQQQVSVPTPEENQ